MLKPEPPASGSVTSVATASLDALEGLATHLPASTAAQVRGAAATCHGPAQSPLSNSFHIGTADSLPDCILAAERAKTAWLVVPLATPLAIAAPPLSDIGDLVRNLVNDSIT